MGQLNGRMKVFVASTDSVGVGKTDVAIRPPGPGIEWKIIWAIGKQYDGAVIHGWTWTDPDNPAGLILYQITGALEVPLPLGAMGELLPSISMGPWWATWDRYPSYHFNASAGAKNGLIVAIVVEHVGVEGLE